MKLNLKVLYLAGALVGTSGAEVVLNPVNFGMAVEESQIFKANQYQGGNFHLPLTMVRPTGWIFQSATIEDQISLVFGLGATAFTLPRDSAQFPGSSSYKHEWFPAVALVQASGSYAWGDGEHPMFKATFGQLPYKYNPSAKNMGEYLLRSTPYPNTVLNSPFDLVNAAQASILGVVMSGNFAGEKWKNDLLFTSATSSYPLYDFSLAYITRLQINSIFELGAGVNFFRLIPIQPDVTTYEGDALNAYFTGPNGRKYTTNASYYATLGDSLLLADSLLADSVNFALAIDPSSVPGVNYYTLKGEMLMAYFSVDLKPILGETVDLKLYGEWALLGIKNYPVFYEKQGDRMPLMLGLNIPTWGLLDQLNLEVEYWKNPYLNSSFKTSYGGLGTPNLDIFSYNNLGLTEVNTALKDDDFKWSISATKSLGSSLSLTAKAAKDHLQVMQEMQAGFPGKSYGDVMSGKDSWYYVLRVQLAI